MSKKLKTIEINEATVDLGRRSALLRHGLAASAAYAAPGSGGDSGGSGSTSGTSGLLVAAIPKRP